MSTNGDESEEGEIELWLRELNDRERRSGMILGIAITMGVVLTVAVLGLIAYEVWG
jgi:hypothetical protein